MSDIETFPPGAGFECVECELTVARSGAVNKRAKVGLNEVLVFDFGGV